MASVLSLLGFRVLGLRAFQVLDLYTWGRGLSGFQRSLSQVEAWLRFFVVKLQGFRVKGFSGFGLIYMGSGVVRI